MKYGHYLILIIMLLTPLSGFSDETPETTFPDGKITMRQALSLALENNPELSAFSFEVRSMEARAAQAGLFPNPEFDLEVENVGGQGDMRGFIAAETTLQLSQRIELGGKRSRRNRLASFETSLAEWDYESKRLNILTDTTAAFLDVLAAQAHLHLSEDALSLAEQVMRTVAERVRAGKVSPLEETRTSVLLSTSKIKKEKALRDLNRAKKRLAAMWGAASPGFEEAVGDLDAVGSIPTFDLLIGRIEQNPEIARWMTEMDRYEAALDLEKAGGIPDLTLAGGYRRFGDIDADAFVFGVSVTLPLFDRNQGSVREAEFRLSKAREERRAQDVRIRTALADAHASLFSAHAEVKSLRNDVLPAADRAYEATREGYRHGKFGFLDVLEAQRTLVDVRGEHINALTAYHKARAGLARLIGGSLDEDTDPDALHNQGEVE
jgi:cobalt-zinc-cadmium efflux system outer membrane protein